tara:strand:- start:1457 stop:1828 length:372 start_codon:yes stop_codon:yes gene_type:complete
MWQLRRLSTNEPLSAAGPLPNNWGPIFGLGGFLEKIGDLSWISPAYADQGWFELTEAEELVVTASYVMDKVKIAKTEAKDALSNPAITVGDKVSWNEYLLALDDVCSRSAYEINPSFPAKPNA